MLRHWICCLMLSRLNSEHILRVQIFSISVIHFLSPNWFFPPCQSESHQTNTQGTTVSSSALWHIRKASYSGWERCDSKHRSNLVKSRQLKIFLRSTLYRWFLSFYSSSVLKHSKTNLCASNPWRNGSASDSRSEGCYLVSIRNTFLRVQNFQYQ